MGLEHIGQKLKTARDGLGLSLSQIHERTKIPFNHLQAIDNGQGDDLPEPVYVSGFIKRYAECVGLNGPQLAEEYKEELEGTANSNGGFAFMSRGLKEQQVVAPPPTNYFNRTRIEQPPPNLFKLVLFPACFVVLVLGLMIFLANRQQNSEVAQDPSVLSLKDSAKFTGLPTPPPATPAESPPPVQAPTATATATPAPAPASPLSNDARVTLTGMRRVWIEVKSESSGETKYNGFLDTGDQRDFQDSEGLRIIAGSGGNLSVEANGKTETFGAPGKRTERVFMAKNAAATAKTAEAENQTSKTTASSSSSPTTPAKKPPAIKKSIASARDHASNKRLDSLPSRQYMPGESLGSGTRAIDVPYRY